MPMPVSRTSKRIASSPCATSASVTEPFSVNLKALDSRFLRICCRRWLSVTMASGRPGIRSTRKATPFCSPTWSNICEIRAVKVSSSTGSGSIVRWPASILERSRMSLIRFSRSVLAAWMVAA
ncbi:hypothetical protein D3C87_1589060 [compost metagenome]